jgi:hypothetical protein
VLESESGLSESGDGRLLKREGRLCCLKKGRLPLSSELKFTKHFLSNKNYFSIDYYFHPHQTRKKIKINFFRNHFTPKQTVH